MFEFSSPEKACRRMEISVIHVTGKNDYSATMWAIIIIRQNYFHFQTLQFSNLIECILHLTFIFKLNFYNLKKKWLLIKKI